MKHKSDYVSPTLLNILTSSPPLPTPMALSEFKMYSKALQWPSSPNGVWPLVNTVASFPNSHSWCSRYSIFFAVLRTFQHASTSTSLSSQFPLTWNSLFQFLHVANFYSGVCSVPSEISPNFLKNSLLEYKPHECRDFFCFVHCCISQLRILPVEGMNECVDHHLPDIRKCCLGTSLVSCQVSWLVQLLMCSE